MCRSSRPALSDIVRRRPSTTGPSTQESGSTLPQTPLTQLQALEFVVQELALYLDTHPDDAEAFELFRQYTAMERDARAAYGSPLLRSETAESKTYTWLKDPWPWNIMEEEGK